MQQVSREAFFAAIGHLDVHPCIRRGPWPYTADWKLRAGAGAIIGRTEERLIPGSAFTKTLYFLNS